MKIDIPQEILQYQKTQTEKRKSLSPVKALKTPKVIKDAK